MVILVIVVVLILVAILAFIGVRNSIIAARNRCDQAWSDVEVQLKRRHDLVPNLIETVAGYASHERETLEAATRDRAAAMSAAGPEQAGEAERQLSGALADLRAVAENYPELRATENFQQLSSELTQIEEQIQAARRAYNSHTRSYNTKIQVFPNSLIATLGGFKPGRYFEIDDDGERAPAQVRFGDS